MCDSARCAHLVCAKFSHRLRSRPKQVPPQGLWLKLEGNLAKSTSLVCHNMAVRTSKSGYGPRPTDSLWRPFAARDRSEKNRKLLFSKVVLKAKSVRKVVVSCGCNTAQFEIERNEKKKSFRILVSGASYF